MTLLTENCPWQTLMDGPYDRWQQHSAEVQKDYEAGKLDERTARKRIWGFGDMLVHGCNTKAERIACVLGKLNQQIENGGVIQWVDNGYAYGSIDYLEDFLTECGPTGVEIWTMLKPFLEDYMDEDGEGIRQYDEEEGEWEEAFGVSDRLSDKFYALQEKWHPEVYALLAKQD